VGESGLYHMFAKHTRLARGATGSNPVVSAMAISSYGKIPLKNLEIYNGVYDLQFSPTDINLLSNMFTMLVGGNFEYVVKAATNQHDYVLKFSNNYDQVLTLKITDPVAAKNGYKIIRLANDRYYLKFLPSHADIPYLNALANLKNADDTSESFIFESINELKDFIFKHDLNLIADQQSLKLPQIQTVYWLCNKLPQYDESLYTNFSFGDLPKKLSYIIDVIQLPDDTRIAWYIENLNDYMDGAFHSTRMQMYVVTPDDMAYNWTDPKRYFSHTSDKTGFGRVYYVGPNPKIPDDLELVTKYLRGNKFLAIENSTLDLLEKREQRRLVEEAALNKAKETITAKLQDKAQGLNTGGTFTFNDITFSEHALEYEGQVVQSKDIKVCEILDDYRYNIDDDVFNFENVYDAFCRALMNKATTTYKKVHAMLGDVSAEILATKRKNVKGIETTTIQVNDMHINKDEIVDVLLRAICYTKTTDFNNYLDSVSKCSLKYHRVIASGIVLTVKDTLLDEKLEFKIGLERDKNRNFISFDGITKYPVKDTNRLLNLLSAVDMTRVINILVDPNIVGITGADIKYIIKTGKEALAEERTKEKQMLDSAVKLFNCELLDDTLLDNGRTVSGYTVKGKLREYIVDTKTLRVFEYPSGRYLCMVDKGQNEHANTARLVSRMFALANDSKLAKEITTLAQ
jgi:hypothetical protein